MNARGLEAAFDNTELGMLSARYLKDSGSAVEIFRSYRKIKALLYNGRIYGSVMSRSNSSTVVAKHPINGLQVAQVQYFCFHKFKNVSSDRSVSVFVQWYEISS